MKKHLLIGLTSGVLALALLVSFAPPGDRYFQILRNLDIFSSMFKELNAYYVEEVEPGELMKTGIEAMLASLDPYTNYIPEEDIEDYRTMATGQYGGIGAVVGVRGGRHLVIMPFEGYPAHDAGLRIGDQLIKIDDIDLADRSYEEISELLKGQAGTELKLTIKRYGKDQPEVVKVMRKKITLNNVAYSGMVDDRTGIIKLTDFTTGASAEVKEAIEELRKQGAERMIFDLRDNPGGLLTEAIYTANIFVDRGKLIVSTKGKVEDWNQSYSAKQQALLPKMPLAILTSNFSASASEIVAGAVQDYDRGVLVGQRTFGKGLVQTTRDLSYNSKLKVTTAKYYIPSGRCIQAIDYSLRDDDGAVVKVPDSLKTAFRTANGRVVYDGGGVVPDILVEKREAPVIVQALVRQNLLFDFATVFTSKMNAPPNPATYDLTDAGYATFLDWVALKDFSYSTPLDTRLSELKAQASSDGHLEKMANHIAAMEAQLRAEKKLDFQHHRQDIEELIEQEIVSRFYLREGVYAASMDVDPEVQAALEVLNDPARYKRLLLTHDAGR